MNSRPLKKKRRSPGRDAVESPPFEIATRLPQDERKPSKTTQPTDLTDDSTYALLESLGIGRSDWDILMVGDGSGSSWERCGGWGVSLLWKRPPGQDLGKNFFVGAATQSSISFAEVMPYLQAMSWYEANVESGGFKKIHIVTDSRYLADSGNSLGKRDFQKNSHQWLLYEGWKRQGYSITCHWQRRETSAWNRLADTWSKEARKTLMKLEGEIPTWD